jgi:hypothetical protein
LAHRPRIAERGLCIGPGDNIEFGQTGSVSIKAQAIVTFVREIGLKLGDTQRLSIKGPNGQPLAERTEKSLDRNKAQVSCLSASVARLGVGHPECTK